MGPAYIFNSQGSSLISGSHPLLSTTGPCMHISVYVEWRKLALNIALPHVPTTKPDMTRRVMPL